MGMSLVYTLSPGLGDTISPLGLGDDRNDACILRVARHRGAGLAGRTLTGAAAAWSGFASQMADIAANVAAFSLRKAATSPSTPPVFEDLK